MSFQRDVSFLATGGVPRIVLLIRSTLKNVAPKEVVDHFVLPRDGHLFLVATQPVNIGSQYTMTSTRIWSTTPASPPGFLICRPRSMSCPAGCAMGSRL